MTDWEVAVWVALPMFIGLAVIGLLFLAVWLRSRFPGKRE